MRQKRAKSYRKQMLVYNHTFKFREPYQVIVDDEIVLNCDKASFDLKKGLSRTIQAEVKPMITQCCMQQLYLTRNQSAIDLAKTFERRRCNHREAIPSHECIKSIVNIDGENKHRYVVATENERLRYSLRKIPGVPLVYMNRSVMVMELLSKASAQVSRSKENSKLTGGLNSIGGEEEEQDKPVTKKRKGPKEPNPLSIKKKAKKDENKEKNTNAEVPKKRKRARKHKSADSAGESTEQRSDGTEEKNHESGEQDDSN